MLLTGCNVQGAEIFGAYSRESGSLAPLLGASSASSWPPTTPYLTFTSVQNANGDDANVQINLPFSFTINDTAYTSVFVGSNCYLTFGSGSNLYSGLSASVPNLNKFHIGSADRSWQRVAHANYGNAYSIIRFEGGATAGGMAPGSSDILYEVTFINPLYYSTKMPVMALRMGNAANNGSTLFGVYNTTTAYATTTLAQNTSYVFEATNMTGTAWTIYTGQYIWVI